MPHDKNGIEIKLGDVIRFPAQKGYIDHEMIGAVLSVTKGADMCNLGVEAVGKQAGSEHFETLPVVQRLTVTAADCERLA